MDSAGYNSGGNMAGRGDRAQPERGATARGAAVRASAGRGNLLSQAITLVLHHPWAAKSVTHIEALGALDRPGVGVLKELLEQAAALPKPSTAMLLERWRDRPEYTRLSELAHHRPHGRRRPPAPLRSCRWRSKSCSRSMDRAAEWTNYCERRRILGLNSDEKAELSLLLKAKRRPQAPRHDC